MMVKQKGTKRKREEGDDILKEAPREIGVVEYVENRAAEIKALHKYLGVSRSNRLVMQLLPKGLRRRALSHNIKRLPRRLREAAKKEYVNRDTKARRKPPSRKFRRRPKNLLEEYNRRQRKHVWLETHIWHAKRFKMEEKWGYKIPIQPTDKSKRASYRSTKHHCLIQDHSYMCCIELKGPEHCLLDGLCHMTNNSTGQTFAAKGCLSGIREGHTMLYCCDQYPLQAIGCASFLWKPVTGSDITVKTVRHLWIWVHPACHDQICQNLEKSFQSSGEVKTVTPANSTGISNRDNDKTETDDTPQDKSITSKSVPTDSDNNETSKDNSIKPNLSSNNLQNNDTDSEKELVPLKVKVGEVEIESLKDRLVRLRLTGPASQTVLAQTLQVADMLPQAGSSDLWWHQLYGRDHMAIAHTQQRQFWNEVTKCRSPGELTPHLVLGLTVRDPRILMPDIRTKATETQEVESDSCAMSEAPVPDVSLSAIWDQTVRSNVKQTKLTDQKLNHLKSDHLIPGTPLDLGEKESKIPIILIQTPGVRSRSNGQRSTAPSYGSGWDIVIPAGWSMAFWVAFNYRCARAGGLRESESLAHEQGVLHFPQGYPDTVVGREDETNLCHQLMDTYNKKPPAKRPNYTKLGIQCPFQFPWRSLVKQWAVKEEMQDEWNQTGGNFYVMRDKTILKKMSKVLSDVTWRKLSNENKESLFTTMVSMLNKNDELLTLGNKHTNCLVPVEVTMVTRGCSERFANIAIPLQEDLARLVSNPKSGAPMETIHKEETRREKNEEKKKKRKLQKSGGACKTETMDSAGKNKVGNENKNSADGQGEALDVDEISVDLIDSCSRPVIGYIKEGGFTLGVGNGRGLGFVSFIGLLKLLDTVPHKLPCTVLVRSTTSYQYRYAYINIPY
ncbi:ribonucleases P/MRP protein subunit POP1-like isoform X2 [Mizuhopecten yessoensis]|uniref:Ribonucleases P/MRP protein subunit POP1 n=1 Tax=Mizuhopecten yessoensis TaxID=6573 RepID=A0A210Q2U4_MIZYE|nr:ribonucleases P/MRP protein subunit POP1-like isoform X2 [Mizuhopecten yessoensis]OWF43056.1 Ribonucleases P/MRP protein subunit POP1 [Mizuhopecten yessoensis]